MLQLAKNFNENDISAGTQDAAPARLTYSERVVAAVAAEPGHPLNGAVYFQGYLGSSWLMLSLVYRKQQAVLWVVLTAQQAAPFKIKVLQMHAPLKLRLDFAKAARGPDTSQGG